MSSQYPQKFPQPLDTRRVVIYRLLAPQPVRLEVLAFGLLEEIFLHGKQSCGHQTGGVPGLNLPGNGMDPGVFSGIGTDPDTDPAPQGIHGLARGPLVVAFPPHPASSA